jgi:hypothetical protein
MSEICYFLMITKGISKQLLYNKCPKFDGALKFSTPLDAKKTIILSTSEHTFIF